MGKRSNLSTYLDEGSLKSRISKSSGSKRGSIVIVLSLLTMLVGIFVAQPVFSSVVSNPNGMQTANAGAFDIFCGQKNELGGGMDDQGNWQATLVRYPLMDLDNRTWTLQEAFSSNLNFTKYSGEGGEDMNLVVDVGKERGKDFGTFNDNVADKLEPTRGVGNCLFGTIIVGSANIGMDFASFMSFVTQQFATFAFSSNLVCSTNDDNQSGCFNLLKVIGGDGTDNDGGLIGTLTSSIYLPMLVLVVAAAAMLLAYQGIVQRKIREAFFGFIWICAAVILGLAFLYNPALLAKAPMAVSNSVGTCVIGAFNGQNCFTDGATNNSDMDTESAVCLSEASNVPLDQQMELTVNSLSCSIWKAFILEPYAVGSFGQSFDDLDVKSNEKTKAAVEAAGFSPDDFCINLASTKAGEDMENSTLELNSTQTGGKLCNLAAYQLYLMTDAESSGSPNATGGDGSLSAEEMRWYRVVLTTAEDNDFWNTWSYSFTSGFGKIGISSLAVITSFLGGIVIIVISFLAIMYYLISVILMALAPLFFLLAVHPTRGRKMFLGWASQVISNILKYLASAMFLIVTIALYGAVLGNSENIGTTFIFVLILTGALLLYRGEIVNLIGKADFGGEKLSNKFAEKVQSGAKSLGRGALGMAGGAAGGLMATGLSKEAFKDGSYFKNSFAGARDNVKRDLKRGRGFVSSAARSAERVSTDNRRDMSDRANKASKEAATAQGLEQQTRGQFDKANSELGEMQKGYDSDRAMHDDLKARAEVTSRVEDRVIMEMSADNKGFADAQQLLNQIRDVKGQQRVAAASGDREGASQLSAQETELRRQYDDRISNVSHSDRTRGERRYNTMVSKGQQEEGVDFSNVDREQMIEAEGRLATAQSQLKSKYDEAERLQGDLSKHSHDAARASAEADVLGKEAENWRPGDTVTSGKMKRTQARAAAEADKRMDRAKRDMGETAIAAPAPEIDDVPKVDPKPVDRPTKPEASYRDMPLAEKEKLIKQANVKVELPKENPYEKHKLEGYVGAASITSKISDLEEKAKKEQLSQLEKESLAENKKIEKELTDYDNAREKAYDDAVKKAVSVRDENARRQEDKVKAADSKAMNDLENEFKKAGDEAKRRNEEDRRNERAATERDREGQKKWVENLENDFKEDRRRLEEQDEKDRSADKEWVKGLEDEFKEAGDRAKAENERESKKRQDNFDFSDDVTRARMEDAIDKQRKREQGDALKRDEEEFKNQFKFDDE